MSAAKDAETIAFYRNEASTYAARGEEALHRQLRTFMATLPAGAKILELGCGAGQDSAAMIAAGFDVTPTDGTPEIALEAERRLGRPVKVLLFEDIAETEAYDGVWANACLLHVPRSGLAAIIDRIYGALRPGGSFYSSFKAGTAEGRDTFGRYFNYPDANFIRQAFQEGRWAQLEITLAAGSGYDRLPTDWLQVLAHK